MLSNHVATSCLARRYLDLEIAGGWCGTGRLDPRDRRPAKPTLRQIFAIGEFRALWLAQLLLVAGDQLLLCWLQPDLAGALLIIVVSGHAPPANWRPTRPLLTPCRPSAAGSLRPDQRRHTDNQGPWIVLAGVTASSNMITPAAAIAVSGGLGAVLAAAFGDDLVRACRHTNRLLAPLRELMS